MRSIIAVAVLGLLAVVPAAQAGRTASEPRVSVHLVDTTLKAVRNRGAPRLPGAPGVPVPGVTPTRKAARNGGALRLHVTTEEPITIRVSVKRRSTTFASGLNRV